MRLKLQKLSLRSHEMAEAILIKLPKSLRRPNNSEVHWTSSPRDDNSQQGFSQLILVGLIAAGIIAGTLLIQNGTGFLPRADENQEPLNPSAGKTTDCSLLSDDTQKLACEKNNNEVCARDTVTYCDNRSGTPRAIRKSGGYWEPGNANADPASGCVFDYREVSGKNSECGKTESKSGDVVYTTKDEAKDLDSKRADEVKKGTSSSQQSTSGGGSKNTTACTEATSTAYNDAKVANNLARFYAIQKGAGGLCVPADLGVPVKDDITIPTDKEPVEGRLMMCSTSPEDGSTPKLYWMVATYSEAVLKGKTYPAGSLLPVPEDQKQAPDKDTIVSGFGNLPCARFKAGLDKDPSVCKF